MKPDEAHKARSNYAYARRGGELNATSKTKKPLKRSKTTADGKKPLLQSEKVRRIQPNPRPKRRRRRSPTIKWTGSWKTMRTTKLEKGLSVRSPLPAKRRSSLHSSDASKPSSPSGSKPPILVSESTSPPPNTPSSQAASLDPDPLFLFPATGGGLGSQGI